MPALDRTVHRLTRGKVLLSARVVPGLVLTVPGARTGRPRTTPLVCMPEGAVEGTWILVGSNFGRTGHPAWTANLLARPDEAVINWRGRDIPVRAVLLEGEERARVWRAVLAFWPPYAAYQERVEREIRLFRLERR
ncbi:nitroreductase/quinone reductase family protein [Streptomyces sp. NPDC101181]|uniref:nitroreductase/quinone reductase family protein n=1 Tax=Streptomyces sp. NPDC101181 TaxID=3366125 RepID=UPI0038218EEB